MGDPPSFDGALHETTALPGPTCAVGALDGGEGFATGLREFDAAELAE